MAKYEFTFTISGEKVTKAVNDSRPMREVMESQVSRITGNANSMGAGFRTSVNPPYRMPPNIGNKQPRYVGDVRKFKGELVGLVHPDNYAAMKDNYLHNTLLKSI